MNNLVKQVREFDKEKVLETFLEDNAREFPMYSDSLLRDEWIKKYREFLIWKKKVKMNS